MSDGSLGRLMVSVGLDSSDMQKGLTSAQGQVKEFQSQIKYPFRCLRVVARDCRDRVAHQKHARLGA
jgi:hypothetical protein